jgi:hypothetical protein
MDFINKFKFNAPAFADVFEVLEAETFTTEEVERFDALTDDDKRAVLAIAEEYGNDYDDKDNTVGDLIDWFEDGRAIAYTWVNCYGEGHLKPIAEDCAENWGVLSEVPEHLRGYFDIEKWFNDVQLEGSWSWSRRAGCWVEWRG